jgi:hypothetical protein
VTLQAFINIFSIVLAFVASLFFCLGSANLKVKDIDNFSGTYWGGNASLRSFFVSLKADYLCGAFALMFAFLLQILANAPGGIPPTPLFQNPNLGSGLAILMGAAVGGLFWAYRSWVIKSIHKAIAESAKE